MPYQLKTTGIAVNCTMCVAVDPDTNTIKDFASSAVTAAMTVGANVTISEQAWDGITRKFFRLGSGTAAADFVEFGAAARPQWDFNAGESRTWVFIGEAAGPQVRAFGANSSAYMAAQNLGAGGSTFPTMIVGGTATGGAAPLASGDKRIFGFSITHGSASNFFHAADTATSMTTGTSAALAPAGVTFDFAVQFVGRRNDSTAKQQDKIHAVLIFNRELTEAEWDSLRGDWFTVLLEDVGGDTTPPTLTGSITIGTVTSASIQMSWPTGSDNVAVTSYEVSSNGGSSYTDVGNVTTHTFTGLTASTSYGLRVRAKDAASNVSTPALAATQSTSGSSTPISFAGTVPTANFTIGTAGSVNLASYFSGSLTPFTFALDGASAALPSGVTLSSAGLLSWSGSGTAGTTTGVIVQGTDTGTNTADTNAFSIAIAAAPTGNIRLQPALDLQRGGDAASLTGLRWCVYTDGLMTAIAHSGGGLSTNSSGQATIDINGSSFAVGDWLLLHIADPNTAVAAPADRNVGTFLGWVQAIAQA